MTISGPLIEELIKEMYENFYIIKMISINSWYYHELRPEPIVCGVVWTPRIQLAHKFHNEKTVEEFKAQFISPRKVEILRITRDD